MKELKVRRALAFLLAAAMAAGVLASCGGEAENSTGESSEAAGNSGAEVVDDGDYVELIWLSPGTAINEEDKSLTTAEAAKRTGIFVQRNYVPEEKWNVLMASGDMEADILEVPSVPRYECGV